MKKAFAVIYKNRAMYIMLAAPMVILALFHYVPLYGLQIAFKDYSAARSIAESPWVGFKHFSRFFGYYGTWGIIRNTLTLSLYGLATFPLAMILALLLDHMPLKRFTKTVQIVSYAPHFISMVVMCGMILQFFDKRTGIFNSVMSIFGVAPQNYMAIPSAFYHIFIWTSIWQDLGYASIIYIAALSGVSPELHEAAIVDGATIMKRIIHIDIPSILPTVCIMLILRCGSILSLDYEKVFLLQNSLNLSVSEILSTFVYKQGLTSALPQYSYSTAIGLCVSIVNFILLSVANALSRAITGNSMW